MALVAAARGGARRVARKTARSLSSGADVHAGSGYVFHIKKREKAHNRGAVFILIGSSDAVLLEYGNCSRSPPKFQFPKYLFYSNVRIQ